MNAAAEAVMKELPDLVLAFGNSDEYRYAARHPLDVTKFETYCCPSELAQSCWFGLYIGRSICIGGMLS